MMETVAVVFIWISAVAHAAFMLIEMFPWDRPFVFNLVKLKFNPQLENEKVAAAIVHNAGLYNGFIAVGLVFCALHGGFHARLFFLGCAIVAGIFGAVTLTPKTLLIQTLPALVALIAIHLR
jgi:putative membrane protein